MQDLFVELLQISLGTRDVLSRVPTSKEWNDLFDEAERQAVSGIAFEGVKKLPNTQRPPQILLLEWIGVSEQIRQQNIIVDKQTREIWSQLKKDGFDAAILKGQGIATLYGELAPYRQSGDIDIWVKGGYQKVCDYVQRTHATDDVAYHRFHYDYFEDTEVELHHRPTLMRNLLDDRKLDKWYNSFGADSFVYLEDKGFAVPSLEFNKIFILTHIYRHFLFEGIGLRHVMDYYFVLKNDHINSTEITEIGKTLKSFRMQRFAEAMMWILHTQLGLEEKYLICGMNEKEGRFALAEITQTGNFGYTDTRYTYRHFSKLRRQVAHGAHLLLHYPSEVIWSPIWLVYHKVWKWRKKRDIHVKRGHSSHDKSVLMHNALEII
jgi:hypothetical protein